MEECWLRHFSVFSFITSTESSNLASVVETERFQTASEANRLQTLPIGPARGLITDRNGLVLAENRPNLQLLVVPEEFDDSIQRLEKCARVLIFDGDGSDLQKILNLGGDHLIQW